MTQMLRFTDVLGCPPHCPSRTGCPVNRNAPLGCLTIAKFYRSQNRRYAAGCPPFEPAKSRAEHNRLNASLVAILTGLAILATKLS